MQSPRPSRRSSSWAAVSLVLVLLLAISSPRAVSAAPTQPATRSVSLSPQAASASPAVLDLTQFVSLQVTVNSTSSSGVSYDVIDRSLSVSSSWSGSTLTIDVNSGRTGAALEVIQLEVAGSVLAGEPPSSIKVAVNGTAVPLAPSITSLLSTGAGSPSYMISSAAAVYQLLIAIPRASRNTLSMGFPAGSTFLSEFTGLFIVVAAGVALMAALVYLRSRAASRRLGKRIILENN